MLLRVDVFPHNVPVQDGTPKSPLDPMYVSLSTSSSEDGTILTVGRKAPADVIFSNDKSISRQHLSLRLVSKTEAHQEQLKENDQVVAAAAAKPSSPEEIQACDDCDDGMCVVLSELGSKFGTFLAVERNDNGENKPPKDDDDETGDETEDEGDGPSSGMALSTTASQLVENPATKVFNRVETNSNVVLKALSTPGKTVVIQCGQNGSLIRVTRVPLNILWSRVEAPIKKLWTKRLYAMGASYTDSLEEMTHLVVAKRESVAKQLTAWSSLKPIVTPNFLKQLWDRKIESVMPNEREHMAEGGAEHKFWDTKPNPNLWKNCTLLCIVPGDIVSLCRAGGSKIIPVDGLKIGEFRAKVDEAIKNEVGCFFVDTSSRKATRLVKELKDRGIPHVTQQRVASCIVDQKPLTDLQDNPIGPPIKDKDKKDAEVDETPAVATASSDPGEGSSKDEAELEASKSQSLKTASDRDMATSDLPEQSLNGHACTGSGAEACLEATEPADDKPEPEEAKATSKASKSREKRKHAEEEPVEPPPNREVDRASKRTKVSARDEAETQEPKSTSQDLKRKRKQDKETDVSPPREDQRPSKRKKLPISSGGWFVAAPSGSKRSTYRRSNDELVEALDGREVITAGTEKRSGLVVKRVTTEPSAQLRPSSGRGNVVNYKKFRKNSVPRGGPITSRIQLRSVLPKESEREHELELQQRQMEEQQRLADALFNEPVSGSMRSFFKPKGRKTKTRRV